MKQEKRSDSEEGKENAKEEGAEVKKEKDSSPDPATDTKPVRKIAQRTRFTSQCVRTH